MNSVLEVEKNPHSYRSRLKCFQLQKRKKVTKKYQVIGRVLIFLTKNVSQYFVFCMKNKNQFWFMI